MVVYTIGHSTHPLARFIDLCRAHGVHHVIDVRRFPGSRRQPHFAREPLERALAEAGVGYSWFEVLGGRRKPSPDSPHTAWRVASFAAYADHMETEAFEEAMGEVLAIAGRTPAAIMCAEAQVHRCHRRLIADWLDTRGIEVRHIASARRAISHVRTPFARLDGRRLVYDAAPPASPHDQAHPVS